MTPEEFRAAGHAVVDWIADYRARDRGAARAWRARRRARSRPRLPATPAGGPRALRRHPRRPRPGRSCPGLSHWQHPRFFGYFPSNGSLASVLGDYAEHRPRACSACRGSRAPALTEVEEVVTDWLRQMVGLSTAWSGVIQDTASTSTLVALLCARERATDYALARGGLQAEARSRWWSTPRRTPTARSTRRRCWPASAEANIRHVAVTTRRYAMRADALAAAIDATTSPPAACRAPSSPRPAPPTTTALDPVGADRRGRARPAASGCTWTRPWPARR